MSQRNFVAFQVAITGSAQQLASNAIFSQVVLTAKSTNTASIEISVVSNTSTTTGYILEKGTSVTLQVSNTSQIFVFGTTNDILSVIGS